VADIDVDHDEVLFEEVEVRLLVEVDVEDLAVAAPVATEVEDDALVFVASLLEGCGDVGCGVRVGDVEVLLDGWRGSYGDALGRCRWSGRRGGCCGSWRSRLAAED
jgi:hypothetical protein